MNRKAAKLLRLYIGQSKREGVPVLLKDAKRRYAMLPWTKRGPVNAAMRNYVQIVTESSEWGALRATKPRVEQVKRMKMGFFDAIAQMLGLTRSA